ncbi:MAG TPA: hypothetical protein VH637_04765 [Streptosporangiaceae bacterium]
MAKSSAGLRNDPAWGWVHQAGQSWHTLTGMQLSGEPGDLVPVAGQVPQVPDAVADML